MYYRNVYVSPLGRLVLLSDHKALYGLWFEDHPGVNNALGKFGQANDGGEDAPVLGAARLWLDAYFAGRQAGFYRPFSSVGAPFPSLPPFHLEGTPFQKSVWQQLSLVPYGQTITYGELAARVAAMCGVPRFSAQAVGHALACNPLLLVLPCHRVVGAGGRLIGYAGGVERQRLLLQWERERVGRSCANV